MTLQERADALQKAVEGDKKKAGMQSIPWLGLVKWIQANEAALLSLWALFQTPPTPPVNMP